MFITASFIISQNWKQSKCLSTGKWINNLWYMYTKEYLPAINSNRLLICTTTWMYLKSIVLHEKTQLWENTHCMTPLLWPSDKGKQHRSAVSRQRAGGGVSIKGTETLRSNGNVLLLDCTAVIYAFSELKCTFKKGEFYCMEMIPY